MASDDARINRLVERARILRMLQAHCGYPIPVSTQRMQHLGLDSVGDLAREGPQSSGRARVLYEGRLRGRGQMP